MSARAIPLSRYFDHLPAIFRPEDGDGAAPSTLDAMLRAFEAVLSGTGDAKHPGLAEIIGGIAGAGGAAGPLAGLDRYYEPGPLLPGVAAPVEKRRTPFAFLDWMSGAAAPIEDRRAPYAFLDWLSGWVALSLRADLDEAAQREFIAKAVSLYRIRGTPEGLRRVLEIYTRLGVVIDEGGIGVRVGGSGAPGGDRSGSTLGIDTVVGGFRAHYFEVTLYRREGAPAPSADASVAAEYERYERIARAIIEAEKPAHCTYGLRPFVPASLQVGAMSRVGVDTLVGSGPNPTRRETKP